METIHRPISDTKRFSARRLGELVEAARRDVDLTLEEAAELSGHLSAKYLRAIERGRRRASTHDLLLIAELYGVDPLTLVVDRDIDRVELEASLHATDVSSLEIQEVLAAYLAALHGFRSTGPASIFQLRDDDLATLGRRLHLSRTRLLRELRSLMNLAAAVNSAVQFDDRFVDEQLVGESPRDEASVGDVLIGELQLEVERTGAESVQPVESVEGSAEVGDRAAPPALPTAPPAPGTALAIHAPAHGLLDPDRAAELERIYDELYSSSRRRFFGRRKLVQRHEELRRRQQHLLEEVGCESWTDYMLKVSVIPGQTSNWRPAPLAITAASLPIGSAGTARLDLA